MTVVKRTDTFNENVLAKVDSVRVLNEIECKTILLETVPSLGSNDLPASIQHRFGTNVRRIVCPPFLIIYEYFEDADGVIVYDLIHGRQAY